MAKKTKSTVESGESTSIFGLINSFDKSTEMIEDSKYAKIDEWISTGSYILNACISGSLFGGVPNKRSITFSGMPGCLPGDETIEVYIFQNPELKDSHKIIDLRNDVR
jgi:hypothetical protein